MKKNDMSTMNTSHDKTPCRRDKDHNIKGKKTRERRKVFHQWLADQKNIIRT